MEKKLCFNQSLQTGLAVNVKFANGCRDVFRTLSNICDHAMMERFCVFSVTTEITIT